MVLLVIPPIVLLAAGLLVWVRDRLEGTRAVLATLGAMTAVVIGATLLTLWLSRRPTGAWRMDLLPSIPLLYVVFAAEVAAVEAGIRRFGGGRALRVLGGAAGGLVWMFMTMVLLVVVMAD